MQRLDYGTIKELIIRDGEPVPDPPPRVICYGMFSTDIGMHTESGLADITLKVMLRILLARHDDINNGNILLQEVKCGSSNETQVEKYSLEQRGAVSLLDRRQNITSQSTGHK
jgi:hypothetical protein